MSTDRIEKKLVLRAARERVSRTIGDAKQFGCWFGVAFAFAVIERCDQRLVDVLQDRGG